jgi:hypothetical protein
MISMSKYPRLCRTGGARNPARLPLQLAAPRVSGMARFVLGVEAAKHGTSQGQTPMSGVVNLVSQTHEERRVGAA